MHFGSDRSGVREENVEIIKAWVVRTSLEDFTHNLESIINEEAKSYISEWRKNIYKKLESTLKSELGNDNLDVQMISKTIRYVLNSVIYPEISYFDDFPKILQKSRTLKESEAEEFIEEAYNYISNLKERVRKDIKNYTILLIDTLKQNNIGQKIFAKYINEIEKLTEDIQNKELSLDRLNYIIKQLECVSE